MGAAKKLRNPGRQWIGISNLVIDDAIQSRITLDKEWCRQLSEFRMDGAEFPPADVFDTDEGLLLSSGFHRAEAMRLAGESQLLCVVHKGTRQDAIVHSVASNKSNGCKPMSSKDLRKAAEMLFKDEAWWKKASTIIAEHIGVNPQKVKKWRSAYCEKNGIDMPEQIERSDGLIQPRPAKSGEFPQIRSGLHRGKTRYYARVNGKQVSLSGDKSTAEIKLAALISETKEKKSRRTVLTNFNLEQFLISRGIFGESAKNHGSSVTGGAVLTVGTVLIPLQSASAILIRDAIARAILNRYKHRPSGRAIVVCYDPPECEAIDIAKQLGVEFMTPEQLVDSLTG